MRVLHVMAGGKHGGAEMAFVDTCIAFQERLQSNIQNGRKTHNITEIVVVTRKNDHRVRRLKAHGITVYTLPFGGKMDIYTPFALKRIIKTFKPNIVQTWMSRGTAKTPRWSKSMGIPPYKVVARLGNYYNLKYYKSAEYFIAITPKIQTYLEDSGLKKAHVTHINNLAETEKPTTPIKRTDLDTPDDACVLLALGRLHDAKAFDTLIHAVHACPKNIVLWIAGEGPDREKLEALIQELDLHAHVKLLGWREDRADLFAACDICVFPSRFEPFGSVFIQAWAHKTPVITSDADGPAQFVNHEKDGIIVPIDDIKALTNAIIRVKDDTVLQTRMVTNGAKRYQEEFTTAVTLDRYIDFYNQILRAP